jgi:Flp pilus assembly pilin Flp
MISKSVKEFLKDEEGQSMVEYGVTLGGVAAVSYIAVVGLGDKTADLYAWMANHLPGGEANETGQSSLVRVTTDGLVSLSSTADGLTFESGSGTDATGSMLNTLGGDAVFGLDD